MHNWSPFCLRFGFQRMFTELGVDCMAVHAVDVPTSDKDRNQKPDAINCRKLSKMDITAGLTRQFCVV
jgi:hypothetical protein